MSAGSIKAGEAFVKIWANDAEARKALDSLQSRVKRFGDDVSAMGKQVALVGAAMAAPFLASAKRFSGFADTMSTVKALISETGEEAERTFQRLNDTAKHLGETTSFTAQEAAEGMLALARAGFTAEENIAALPHALNLARAGALGLGEATTIMADTSRSFGIAASESERVADALAKASNISNTDIQGIGEAMGYVAMSGKMAGQSLERISASIAVMANRGLKGSMAGTALAKTLSELAKEKNRTFLKQEFNVDTTDAKGNLRDVFDILKDLNAATANMGNADKLSLFTDMFGERGKKGAMALAENIDEWARFSEQVEKSAGTGSQMAKEMDNNIGGSFRLMMSAIEGVQIALGVATQGTIREWMKSVESTALSVSAFVKNNEQFIVGVMKIGAILLAGGAAIFAFGKGMKIAAGAVGLLSNAAGGLKALQDRLTGVTAAKQAMAAADKALETAGAAHSASIKRQESAQKAQENAFARSEAAAYHAATARQKLDQAERDSVAAAADAAQKRIAVADAEAKATQAIQQAALAHKNRMYGRQQLAGDPNAGHGMSGLPYQQMQPSLESKAESSQLLAAQAKAELTKRTTELAAAENRAANASQAAATARQGVVKADTAAATAAQNLEKANGRLAQSQERTAESAGKLNSAMYGATEAQERMNAALARANAPAENFARGMSLLSQSGASFRQAAGHAGDAVKAVFTPALHAAERAASRFATSVGRTVGPAFARLQQGAAGAANSLRRTLLPAAFVASVTVSNAATSIHSAFQQAADATGQAAGRIADGLRRAVAPAADMTGQAIQRVAGVMNRVIGPAAGSVKAAMDKVGLSFRQAAQSASAFGQAAVGAMGSPKVAAAAGSVAMLAGSISMLAGDSAVGKAAQWVATIAGIGMAASGAVAGVQALKAAMVEMSAGARAATVAFLKLAAAIAVAFVAFKAGQWVNQKISGFDGDEIAKDAKRFAENAVDSSDNLLQAQQKILQRIRELQGKEAEQGFDLGAFRVVNPFGDNQALNAEIAALQTELEGVEEQYRAQAKAAEAAKKAADEAAEAERIELNRKAVKDLADAWDDVLKKLEEVNKQRSDRTREKSVDAEIEADPHAARSRMSEQFAAAKSAEEAIVKRLHELEAKRQELLNGGEADTGALNDLQADIESVLKEYEKAVAETDVWERFYDKADDAVTKTRDSLKKLAEEAKKLDLDHAKKQDDARFKDLLKNDWVSASEEVAQAMARVNSEWLATGQRVAELQAKAEGGDIGAQRELAEALERRKELASERGDLEGRQKEVDSAQKAGERRYDNVGKIVNDEAKYQAKEEWEKEAKKDPRAANAALDSFIADLESQLANTGALAEQARAEQDYAGASAYEEQAKSLQDQLSELRGMKGQTEEKDTVTGDFSARAMEAMMRGGGGQSLEKQQLEAQQSMNERLGKLVDLYAAPTVVAVE